MKWAIEYAPAYLKKARKLARKYPRLRTQYSETLGKLAGNPFDPTLHTHPLTGELKDKYACSLTYELRIVFTLRDYTVRLLDIGTHDEVY